MGTHRSNPSTLPCILCARNPFASFWAPPLSHMVTVNKSCWFYLLNISEMVNLGCHLDYLKRCLKIGKAHVSAWLWGCFQRTLATESARWEGTICPACGQHHPMDWNQESRRKGKLTCTHLALFGRVCSLLLLLPMNDVKLRFSAFECDLHKVLSSRLQDLQSQTRAASLVTLVLRLPTSWTEQLLFSPVVQLADGQCGTIQPPNLCINPMNPLL
jgi:hypothetical protein